MKTVFSKPALDAEALSSLEELLFEADFSFEHIEDLISMVKNQKEGTHPVEKLEHVLNAYYSDTQGPEFVPGCPSALAVVGVNGAGKTTFCARLGHHLKARGLPVLLGAADTFRAGAVEQLKLWGEKTGIEVIEKGMNADSAAVAFDAWAKAKQDRAFLILDTAGRLHTKLPLMEQLEKMFRILGKDGLGAPQHTWLVLDGSIGQNSILQTEEFMKNTPLTGLVVTKLDGSSKGGAALSAASKLKLPLYFVGLGEKATDLKPFDLKSYVRAMLYADTTS